MKKSQIGLIGLATMGANFARNIANHKFRISVYNRTTETMEKFIEEYGNEYLNGEKNIKNFVNSLESPRKIIILVKAGPAVDAVITELLAHLEKNDIIIECGNSQYRDTKRRFEELKAKNINLIGCGISGGEEGALHGPSLMPGGSKLAWQKIQALLEQVAARDFNKGPCVSYIGSDGAGHYVKMVHNGIEYGVMQMMAEAYEMLRSIYKLSPNKISEIFASYNRGKLKSYLFEISAEVLKAKDPYKKGYLIDFILDKAGQKGTGRWTAIDSMERAVATPSISEAVYARVTSGEKDLRKKLSKLYKKPASKKIPLNIFLPILRDGLYAGMLSIYAQGYDLIQKTAQEEKWKIDLAEVSRIWEGGCIIRAKILNYLHKAYGKSKGDKHLFEIKEISKDLKSNIPKLRKLVANASENGIPAPALATAQYYFEAMTGENSSANFIQGLRDYFGAHTFERTDRKGRFHNNW